MTSSAEQPSDLNTDEQLLAAFHRGDRRSLAVLAERYEGLLLGLARALTGREDVALDAVQEAWFRVIKYGGRFDGRSTFKTWMYRIVINRCHDLRRREASHPPRSAASPPPGEIGGHDPTARRDAAELNGRLRLAVEDLTEGQQLLVLLCYHRGVTHGQAADILGLPLGTVKSRLHAALGSLRTRLAAEEHE